tara:strand:- start:3119 stop:4531 length:1413 start_codon:yes stop_codon:yes gene_type:complete
MPTISKNIFWSALTSALQLYTGSVIFIVLAKLMSVEDFGILSFGFSLSALVVIVADFGFSLMLLKDYPHYESAPGHYIFNSIFAKVFLMAIASPIFFIYLWMFYNGDWVNVGALYILFSLAASIIIYLQALLRAQNKFFKYTETNIVYAVLVTVVVIIYLQTSLSLVQLVAFLVLSKVLQMIWTIYLCKSVFSDFSFNRRLIAKLLRKSWSFGLFSILGIFYFMVDTQIISLYLGAKDVALYQSVFRIIFILLVCTDVVSQVLLPYLSFKFYNNEDITELVTKIFLYLLIVGCSLFLFLTTFKSQLLTFLYTPEYEDGVILFLPFSLVVILRTISSLLGNILTISNRQASRVITVGVSLAVSLVLNLILIPKYGILAAAWVSVLVHVILFGMYYVYCKKEIPAINLLRTSNGMLLLMVFVTYVIINYLSDSNLWIVLPCVICWLLGVLVIMRRDNNFEFLQRILREKGVG